MAEEQAKMATKKAKNVGGIAKPTPKEAANWRDCEERLMTAPLRDRLAALIAEWRERADDKLAIGERQEIQFCADDLEATLRAAPGGKVKQRPIGALHCRCGRQITIRESMSWGRRCGRCRKAAARRRAAVPEERRSADRWSGWYEVARMEMEFRYGLRRIPVDAYKEQFALGRSPQEGVKAIWQHRAAAGSEPR